MGENVYGIGVELAFEIWEVFFYFIFKKNMVAWEDSSWSYHVAPPLHTNNNHLYPLSVYVDIINKNYYLHIHIAVLGYVDAVI
jgi:hypothetical protein